MHASLCDFVSDIVQNSIEALSSHVTLSIDEDDSVMRFSVADNGKGMSEEVLQKARDPFYTDGIKHGKRKVGLGIPFLIQAVEAVGGEWSIDSLPGKGTTVSFSFVLGHVDCPPVGDLVGTLRALLAFPGAFELVCRRSLARRGKKNSYRVTRSELVEALGEVHSSGSLNLLKEFLQSQEDSLDEQG